MHIDNSFRLLIISGRSGSGKSVALHMLEDLNFNCIDNLPINLLPQLLQQFSSQKDATAPSIGVGIDARNLVQDLKKFPEVLNEVKAQNVDCEIIFLDADEATLLKRFSETRRKHPLSNSRVSLADAIKKEQKHLEPIAALADVRIDTSHLSLPDLQTLIQNRIATSTNKQLSLQFESFGYKHGAPQDADFVFDVRCLPNPYWDPNLRPHTGLHEEVSQFLSTQPEAQQLIKEISQFLETWLPKFRLNNRSYLTVAIGCTGGQHRSVYVAEALANHFRAHYPTVHVRHRELNASK